MRDPGWKKSVDGAAGSREHMAALIHAVGTAGAAVGSMFVFEWICRAMLISDQQP